MRIDSKTKHQPGTQDSVSVKEFYESNSNELNYEKFKAKISKYTNSIAEKKQSKSEHIIRFVNKGRVIWMTPEQAEQMLMKDENGLKEDIEKALKGDLIAVQQEIQILLANLRHTLEEYREKKALPSEEVKRFTPLLEQREKELKAGVEDSILAGNLLEAKKKSKPFVNEYEQLLAQFIAVRDEQNSMLTRYLAQQLQKHKGTYLQQMETLEKEMNQTYQSRLNLQKSKRNILDTQIDACKTRHSTLLADSTSTNHQQEKACLDLSTHLWKKEKSRVETVIQNIADNVLKQPELKDTPLRQAEEQQEETLSNSTPKKKFNWMETDENHTSKQNSPKMHNKRK